MTRALPRNPDRFVPPFDGVSNAVDTVYFYCAVVGGVVLVVQTVMVLAFGSDSSADADPSDVVDGAHGDAFLKVLSFKTIVAFVTFFGLTGLASRHGGYGATLSAGLAVFAGVLAVYMVAGLMAALARLQSQGNVEVENAVGGTGRVYLRVPGRRAGEGKVTVEIQDRTVECRAVTEGDELPTGANVRVVAVEAANVLRVSPLTREA